MNPTNPGRDGVTVPRRTAAFCPATRCRAARRALAPAPVSNGPIACASRRAHRKRICPADAISGAGGPWSLTPSPNALPVRSATSASAAARTATASVGLSDLVAGVPIVMRRFCSATCSTGRSDTHLPAAMGQAATAAGHLADGRRCSLTHPL